MMWMGTADGPLIGVGFADGRKTALHQPLPSPGLEPDRPVLTEFGGGGSGVQEQMVLWLWPLPPEGPLTVATAWPRGGIEETIITVDGATLVSAANDAEELWPDEAASDPWWGVSRSVEVRQDPQAQGPKLDG